MGPKVHEVMTDRPRCVTPETPVAEAARLMEADDVGSLPILEGEQLTGMVTDPKIVMSSLKGFSITSQFCALRGS